LLSVAGSAAGRLAELLGVEVAEELAGPVVAMHSNHHLAAPLLGQGVEAAHHDGVVIDDNDLLVGHVHLHHMGHDGAQGGKGIGEVLLLLKRVTRVADEYRDPDPAADRRLKQRQESTDAGCNPGRP